MHASNWFGRLSTWLRNWTRAHRKLLAHQLDGIELLDRQIDDLNKLAAAQMQKYQDTITRLIEIPGIGPEAAQEILAEIGPEAASFRPGYVKAVWAVAHRLCKIIWNVLHKGARFIEYGEARNPKAIHRAITHQIKALRRLGYHIPTPTAAPIQARA